ncbi:MAG: hypothetical protein N4A41_09195 [Crocinitomicaceae bacterium]|jgi:hypothetical protein|nr:hypothetical protein [Crocinitomicaceae bacterium]
MEPQVATQNAHKVEGELCHFWLEDRNTLCIEAKDTIFTEKTVLHDFSLIKSYLGPNKKIKLYYDATKILPLEKRVRLLLEEKLIDLADALAVTSKTKIGIMVANIFFALSTTKMPMKMFSNGEEARTWLKNV